MTPHATPARDRSWTTIGVVAFALFLDYFLYGAVIPLTPVSPAGVKSEGQIAILYGAYALSVLILAPLFGYFGDRAGSRVTMLCGAGLAVCAALLFAFAPDFFVMLAARLCQGAASAATWTAGLALIAEHYAGRRVEMMGYAFTGSTVGAVLGPIISGAVYHAVGYKAPFALNGFLFIVEAAFLILFLPAGGHRRGGRVSFAALARNRPVMMAAVAVLLAAFGWGIIEPLMPAHLIRHGASVRTIGIMFAVSAAVYGLFAPVVGRATERFSASKVMAAGAIALALTLPSISVFRRAAFVTAALCVVNVAFAFLLNPASAELADAVDRGGLSCYSSVYAMYNIAYSVGMIAASGFASLTAAAVGFRGALATVGAVLLVCTVALVASGNWVAGNAEASEGQKE